MPILDLSYANLSNFSGIQSSLEYCNLTGANLQNAAIGEGSLYRCDLTDANLTGAIFEDRGLCILCNTIMEDGKISNDGCELKSNWKKIIQEYAQGKRDFTGMDLRFIEIYNLNLEGLNLQKVNLEGAKITYCNLNNIDLSNSNLLGIDFTGSTLIKVNLTNSRMEWANLCLTKFFDTIMPSGKIK